MKTMDKRAVKFLFDTYWSPSGWTRGDQQLDAVEFAHAKSHRVMFDPVTRTHDETIASLRAVAGRLTPRQAADSFLASLSTRRLDWRSALGSFAVARWLPAHEAAPGEQRCAVCGLYSGKHEEDLNVLNFERFKWGGVRHLNPVYELMDLELFLEFPPAAPAPDDFRILREIVAAIEAAPASVTSSALQSCLAGVFKSNKAERDQLIAVLGLCGILSTPEHSGFAEQFVPYRQRALPDRHFVDMAYPACWWTGSAGVNHGRLEEMFGHAL